MIGLKNVHKSFQSRDGTSIAALEGVSFEVAAGRITCIVGPTGSGKSTVLRVAAGLEQVDRGEVASGAAAGRGAIGFLSQRHTLFPWMRVRENIALPLDVRKMPPPQRDVRVLDIVSRLGLAGSEGLFPHELSGGMQQRTALGRLLATDTDLWLMDEPFTALDERTRHQIQQLLVDLAKDRSLTVLFVTHAIDEAVFLADRIIVLSSAPGRVVATIDVSLPRPRNRLDPAYGSIMERVRTSIESVL
jgi:ABC-type nitrate/sulfonate/bicarbonate transport system ATPase subunit